MNAHAAAAPRGSGGLGAPGAPGALDVPGAPGAPDREAAAVFDVTTEAMLAELDAASDAHAAALRPPNTVRGYADDWRTWCEYAAAGGIPVLAARRGTLRGFVRWLWTEKAAAPTTVHRRLTGTVATLRREHRVLVDPADVTAARELLRDLVRAAGSTRAPKRGRGRAVPLLPADLRAMSAACPDTLAGKRDRALLLLNFAVTGRRAEIAGLLVRDVSTDPAGLLVDIRATKTNPRTVAVFRGSNPVTCAVTAWHSWYEAAGLGADTQGPAFRRIDRHGRLLADGLSPAAVGELLARAAVRAGIGAALGA
ncbi:integrase [Catenulispora sp. EB89]|uniref:integrase n=1 Tax=Catenulispora sp. EB89 TaxID=3156257 RepID=UPI0035171F29